MGQEKIAEYEIGDEVIILDCKTRGIIKNVISYLGKGNNIYLVNVKDNDKICVESNLKLCKKSKIEFNVDLNKMAIDFQIEDRINDIIKNLELSEKKDKANQLLNACKLQAYLTTNNDYISTDFKIGNSVRKNELYHGLVNGDYDSIINSYIFSEILKKVGMNVLNVAMKNEEGQFYISNLVLIDKFYYYFDVTLEMAVYQENAKNQNDFVLCCGALGKKSYEQFFKPLCLLNFDDSISENVLPSNIAEEDIDIDVVNKILMMGEDNGK